MEKENQEKQTEVVDLAAAFINEYTIAVDMNAESQRLLRTCYSLLGEAYVKLHGSTNSETLRARIRAFLDQER